MPSFTKKLACGVLIQIPVPEIKANVKHPFGKANLGTLDKEFAKLSSTQNFLKK